MTLALRTPVRPRRCTPGAPGAIADLELRGYLVPAAADVARALKAAPYLIRTLRALPLALADYFPGAPLRLDADGVGLYLCIGVADVEAALLGPLLAFDAAWWQMVRPKTGGRLTVDVAPLDGWELNR